MDPILMIWEEDRLCKEVKESDILHSSRLFIVVVIPFSVRFSKLLLEVTEHIDFIKRIVSYAKEEVIPNLKK